MSATARTQTQLRLPASLHAELVKKAEDEGTTLNALIITLLAGAIGFNLKEERT